MEQFYSFTRALVTGRSIIQFIQLCLFNSSIAGKDNTHVLIHVSVQISHQGICINFTSTHSTCTVYLQKATLVIKHLEYSTVHRNEFNCTFLRVLHEKVIMVKKISIYC